MEKSPAIQPPKKHYWGIVSWEPDYNPPRIIFSGSYNDCWRYLVENFGQYKLSYLAKELGLKIQRIG